MDSPRYPAPYEHEYYAPRPRNTWLRNTLIIFLVLTLIGVASTILGNVATPTSIYTARVTPHATTFIAVAPPQPTINAAATVRAAEVSAEIASIQVVQQSESAAQVAVQSAFANATVVAVAEQERVQRALADLEIETAHIVAQNDVAVAFKMSAIRAVVSNLAIASAMIVFAVIVLYTMYMAASAFWQRIDLTQRETNARSVVALAALPEPQQPQQNARPAPSQQRRPVKRPNPRRTPQRPPRRAPKTSSPLHARRSNRPPNRPEPVREPVRNPRTTSEPVQSTNFVAFAAGEWDEIERLIVDGLSANAIAYKLGGTKKHRLAQVRRVKQVLEQQAVAV